MGGQGILMLKFIFFQTEGRVNAKQGIFELVWYSGDMHSWVYQSYLHGKKLTVLGTCVEHAM